MPMTRAQFRKQLQEGLNANFGLEYRRHPEIWRQFFEVQNSNKAYEEDQLLVGLGGAQVKAEGTGVAYDSGYEGWTARYNHETIALAFAITEEAIEDGLYGNLGAKYSKALARSLQYTKEIKGAAVFNNGFSASAPGGDGKSLFATDHPLAGGGTASNELATPADLSETSLEEVLIQISKFVDDRGIPVHAMPKKLGVPEELKFVAERLLRSNLQPGTANNDVNAVKSTGSLTDYACNRYFTDPDAWFVTTDIPDGLKHMRRKGVTRGIEGDFETGNMRYKSRERYSFGHTDWRAAYGVAGASA
ncbi:MAG: hypothetical protein KF895_02975 [Parvibaculum sp.]|nr:hypothetical protein [Parvibaculum sp.]